MINPYYECFTRWYPDWAQNRGASAINVHRYWLHSEKRSFMCSHFAFAVPDQVALDCVASFGPVVEVGAGTGYWSWLLRQMSVDVVAYDTRPPDSTHNGYFAPVFWTRVELGRGQDVVQQHPDRTLLLCWPNMDDFALHTLAAYRGNRLIYVGEGEGGCTATDDFHEELNEHWDLAAVVEIPQWPGLHDLLFVYERLR